MDYSAIVRQYDRDRFVLSLFLPEEARNAAHVLLAWNLEITRLREQVREPMVGFVRLQWWREALDALYTGDVQRHELLPPLAEIVQRYGIERAWFEDVLVAREQDFSDEPLRDMRALEAYLQGTSSSLLRMMAQVLGAQHELLQPLGVAWGALGVLRALPYHAKHGVLLLPEITPGASESAVKEVCGDVLELAASSLEQVRSCQDEISEALHPLMLYAVQSERILKRMKKQLNIDLWARCRMSARDAAALYMRAKRQNYAI